jgi:hypothetical protein
MRLKPLRRFRRRRDTRELAVDAYVTWREECVAVRTAYLAWRRARGAEAALAFDAYKSALDREQIAAEAYQALMRQVGHLVEPGLARQLPCLPSVPGAPA